MSFDEKIKEIALKHALLNAVKFGGKAKVDAVISKILSEHPELRQNIKSLVDLVKKIVEQVNSMSVNEQKDKLSQIWPEALSEQKIERKEKQLPPLPNADKYKLIVTRFAPNPDGPLHLGSARPIILSHEYARMYKGKFILRFEDTDPKLKRPILFINKSTEKKEYDYIRRDVEWLSAKWDEEYIQSDRMDIYLRLAKELIEKGGAYICTCSQDTFKKFRDVGKPCPHRDQDVQINLELWEKMINGSFAEGKAVLRVKTDLAHPDPSVRDWVAFRIVNIKKYPHPRIGRKYFVWPTYNFAAGVDDHLMGITHVLRAKEHLTNTVKQSYLYKHMNWPMPEVISFGRMKLEGVVLSKSKIRTGISKGEYYGWDDPRLGTLMALRRRGILPETIREIIIDISTKPIEATISWINLAALNRKRLETIANRYMFVRNGPWNEPPKLTITNINSLEAHLPFHPNHPERGFRTLKITTTNNATTVYIDYTDMYENNIIKLSPGLELRLMSLTNIKIVSIKEKEIIAKNIGNNLEYAKNKGLTIIQWVPTDNNVKIKVVMPGQIVYGVGEQSISKLTPNIPVQFYRFGFARLDTITEKEIVFYYSHD
ncbi:MAG: glutamate--tRNA ligase [Thermoprotei archaeon]